MLIGLHTLLGISAVCAGLALSADPSGSSLNFDVQWLQGSLFTDYSIPGQFLGLAIGSTNLISAAGLCGGRKWAPRFSLGTGCLLLVWMTIQTAIIGYRDWTQVVWFSIFILVTVLAAAPIVRQLRSS